MKKLLVILLLIMYGTSSFGMTIHFHYCCGKLKKIDLTPPKESDCKAVSTHMMGAKRCCDNKQVELKIKSEQDASKVFHPSFHLDAAEPLQHNYSAFTPLQNKKLIPEVFAPPPIASQPLFILNCVFRI